MDYRNLLVDVGIVSTCTINRPKVLNALNEETLQELLDFATSLARSSEVRSLILTGSGDKAFIAGADISSMAKMDPRNARAFAELGHRVCDALGALPVPVIAAVNGFALGGGTEIALACDIIYASKKARFGQPEVKLGIIPGFGGTQRLARRVGVARAKEIILAGEVLTADEAVRIGLVNQVYEPEELLPKARALAESIAKRGPVAVAEAKRSIDRGLDLPLGAGNQLEREIFAALFVTHDQREGMAAFLEKRDPKFLAR
jgi:enoyl-CoA hydratase